MVIFLIAMVLWTVMGTATFRRVGHKAIASGPNHSNKCNLNSYRNKPGYDRGLDKCTKCDSFRSIANEYGHMNSRYKKVNCTFEEGEPQWSNEVCTCGGEAVNLFGPAVLSYLFWPLILTGYGYVNAQKKFLDYKGEDWNFFVPAKMVQTKSERLLELEAQIVELEKQNEMEQIDVR